MNEERYDKINRYRCLLGFLLVVCGASAAIWVAFDAYQLLDNPKELTPYQSLILQDMKSTISFEGNGTKLEIRPELLIYFMPVALLSVIVGAAGVLIKGGVQILSSELQMIIGRFDTFKFGLENKIEDFIQNFKEYLAKHKGKDA